MRLPHKGHPQGGGNVPIALRSRGRPWGIGPWIGRHLSQGHGDDL